MIDQGFAAVGGGRNNHAMGAYSTVAGGWDNIASGERSTVAGGNANTAAGYAFAAGGNFNNASGIASFAAGQFANANGHNCAVFSLWGSAPGMQCFGVQSQFNVGALHGMSIDYFSQRPDGGGNRFVYIGDRFPPFTILAWNNAVLTDAGVWVNAASSKDAKVDFATVDASEVLEKVARLPITTWRYREGEGPVRHIGPMAEDFHAAFGVGYGPHTIADLDARGVALAAIQGLNAKLEAQKLALERELEEQRRELAELRRTVVGLLARSVAGDRAAQSAVKDADRIAARSP